MATPLFENSYLSVNKLPDGKLFFTELVEENHSTNGLHLSYRTTDPRKYRVNGTELCELGAHPVQVSGGNYSLIWYIRAAADDDDDEEMPIATNVLPTVAAFGSETFGTKAGAVFSAAESFAAAVGSVGSMVKNVAKATATVSEAGTTWTMGVVAVGFVASIMVGMFKGGKAGGRKAI